MDSQSTNLTSCRNSVRDNPLLEVAIKALEKFDVNLEEITTELRILDFAISEYQRRKNNVIFEEYESVSLKLLFVTYNVKFLVRLLYFQKDNQVQVLKLDIQPKTPGVKEELAYCCNSLQRRRNLNLMFKTLIIFSRFIESRRLICDLILHKTNHVCIEENKDGGIIVVYSDEVRNIQIGIFWTIGCNSTHEVRDFIEVYHKVVELPNKDEIKCKLNQLTEPSLDFIRKYNIWKSLINDLSEKILLVRIHKMPDDSKTTNLCYVSDDTSSDSTESLKNSKKMSPMVVIKKMPSTTIKKPSKFKRHLEREAEGVTILSSDSESDGGWGNNIFSNRHKNNETSTVIDSMDTDTGKSISSSHVLDHSVDNISDMDLDSSDSNPNEEVLQNSNVLRNKRKTSNQSDSDDDINTRLHLKSVNLPMQKRSKRSPCNTNVDIKSAHTILTNNIATASIAQATVYQNNRLGPLLENPLLHQRIFCNNFLNIVPTVGALSDRNRLVSQVSNTPTIISASSRLDTDSLMNPENTEKELEITSVSYVVPD